MYKAPCINAGNGEGCCVVRRRRTRRTAASEQLVQTELLGCGDEVRGRNCQRLVVYDKVDCDTGCATESESETLLFFK